jgi:hypothetical protein
MLMRPRIVDHTPVLNAAQQDAREMVGRFVLAALVWLNAMAFRRESAPPNVGQRWVFPWHAASR